MAEQASPWRAYVKAVDGIAAENEAKPDVLDLPLEERLKLLLATYGWVGDYGKQQIKLRPIAVSVSWGMIMSAVLVGNLAAAIIIGLVYGLARQ